MNLFSRLRKSSTQLGEGIASIFTQRKLDGATLESLEELLIMSDMGGATSASIIAEIAKERHDKEINDDALKALLAKSIQARLDPCAVPLALAAQPNVVLVVGVNGNGKTTTIGKLAHAYVQQGKRVMLVAADTFRAAAVEQLQHWATRSGAAFVRGAADADPASVVFEGIARALEMKADIVLIDTAGRLHTKQNLMAELEKIHKVIAKQIPDAPHHVIQVLDATTGQNAVSQLREFQKVAQVTGLIVTKLDGTAKAGILVALADTFRLPIHAIGVGEGAEDLQPFVAMDFSRALVGLPSAQ